MTSIDMPSRVLDAFRVLDSQATRADVLDACRQLFVHSDQYCHAMPVPFSETEVEAVASAICEYIECPNPPELREIEFETLRLLEGKSLEYCQFASMFSEDMLYQHRSHHTDSLDVEHLKRYLQMYLVGILFRYRFCIFEDRAAFPISVILDYMIGVQKLLAREQSQLSLSDALWATLRAIESLEPL